ncbi:MAG TPA: TatD family hydrolase [Opitutaceae bacterium]|nr:TatD family hydrolase [Opitutaceae bacterium]
MKSVPLYDAHLHLQFFTDAGERSRVAEVLTEIGVRGIVCNGTSPGDWPLVHQLAMSLPWILPSYGLHPWDAGNRSPSWRNELEKYLAQNPHAAVGEIGLDRWMTDRARPDDPRLQGLRRASLPEQQEVLEQQLELCERYQRVVSLHCLEAWSELLQILRKHAATKLSRGFLLHAYGGPSEWVSELADLGAYFSFNGHLLNSRYQKKRDTFKLIPEDRLLVETDAPAMTLPVTAEKYTLRAGSDGEPRNHPANITVAYSALAELRGVSLQSLATRIEGNFRRLFLANPV